MLCTTLETAHTAVCKLVHDFAENEAHYLASGYSEAQARVSFIDKPGSTPATPPLPAG